MAISATFQTNPIKIKNYLIFSKKLYFFYHFFLIFFFWPLCHLFPKKKFFFYITKLIQKKYILKQILTQNIDLKKPKKYLRVSLLLLTLKTHFLFKKIYPKFFTKEKSQQYDLYHSSKKNLLKKFFFKTGLRLYNNLYKESE